MDLKAQIDFSFHPVCLTHAAAFGLRDAIALNYLVLLGCLFAFIIK